MKKIITMFVLASVFFLGCAAKKNNTSVTDNLKGTWQLNYISGTRIAFDGLYPNKKPEVTFDIAENLMSGNSSCNGFSSKYTIKEQSITIAQPLSTMMFCEGGGEQAFFKMLEKVNKYSVNDSTLTFLIDDVAVMRFAKK